MLRDIKREYSALQKSIMTRYGLTLRPALREQVEEMLGTVLESFNDVFPKVSDEEVEDEQE
jgi:hypothetical protein